MTSEKLHDALNLLPADLVAATDALRTKPKKRQVHWQRWAAMAACLAVMLLAGTMFSYFFGHMGSSKTSAAVDKAPMSIAEAAGQKNAAPDLGSAEEAAPADGGHTHAPAGEPEVTGGTEKGYSGSTSVTVTLDKGVHTISGSDADTLTDILEHLDYSSDDICSCSAEFLVETEVGTEYGVNLTEYFARCNAGQAALTQTQVDAIGEIIDRLGE
ncbi:MAG TPA: hypothetical protein DDY90_08265 [Clostridiales bacterium]|nr:hypothetical protein [Clostridiales bacterium]